MALTRANAESILIRRVGTLFTAVGLDGTTVAGTNADLNDPLGYALRRLGYAVASAVSVADTDVDDVSAADTDAFLDVAELRALENAHGAALTLVDISVGPRKESLGQMAEGLLQRMEAKRRQVEADYGIGAGELESGVLNLDFMEKG